MIDDIDYGDSSSKKPQKKRVQHEKDLRNNMKLSSCFFSTCNSSMTLSMSTKVSSSHFRRKSNLTRRRNVSKTAQKDPKSLHRKDKGAQTDPMSLKIEKVKIAQHAHLWCFCTNTMLLSTCVDNMLSKTFGLFRPCW